MMKKTKLLCLLLAALLLFCAAAAEEEESHVTVIREPCALPLLGMTGEEILATPESRALFGIAAFLDADLEIGLDPELYAFSHPTFVGVVEEQGEFIYVCYGEKQALNVYFWPENGIVLYGSFELNAEGELAERAMRYAVENSCDICYEVAPSEMMAAVDALTALREKSDS